MTTRSITYTCGHSATLALSGSPRRVGSKVAYMESLACPACRVEHDQEQDISDFEDAHGLPYLDGSTKQILWARVIRKQKLEQCLEENSLSSADLESLKSQPSASWWIDHKTLGTADLVMICGGIEMTDELPALMGTLKQISWAKEIRRKLLASLEGSESWSLNHDDSGDEQKAIRELRQERRASWWIQNRYSNPKQLIQSADRLVCH